LRKIEIENLSEIIIPLAILCLIQILIWIFPLEIIPDVISLSEFTNVHEQFDIIIGSLVSLIGVYISVTLVAFEFFKQTSGINVYKSILSSRSNTIFISLTITTILISFVNSLLIKSPIESSQQLTALYFNFIIYSIVIIALFPIAFQTFSNLKTINFIQNQIQNLNCSSLTKINSISDEFEETLKNFDNDPLLNIRSILLSLIANNKLTKASLAIDETIVKLVDLIIETNASNTRNILIDRLITFQLGIVDNCLESTNRDSILKNVWNSNYRIYLRLEDQKQPATILSKYREDFFERFYQRLYKHDKEEVILFSLKVIGGIIKNQILNYKLKDENLWVLSSLRRSIQKEYEFDYRNKDESILRFENQHFQEIAIDFLDLFNSIIQKAINYSNPTILNKCFQELKDINFKFRLKDLPEYQSYFFKLRSMRFIFDYAYEAYEKNVFEKGYETQSLLPSLFKDDIHNDVLTSRDIVIQYCLFVLKLQSINKVDRHHLGGLNINGLFVTRGSLGDIANYCLKNLDSKEQSYLTLVEILDTYNLLRKRFKKSKNPDSKTYTKLIKGRLLELEEEINSNGNNSVHILNKIESQLRKYKNKKVE